mmetsp:Transcript_23646/g.34997  ORF Transcript_23646/g.34997 Transcript_23646/m.34997 type:complete len:88 (+) Transcript_23646:465-728(+)
MEWMLVPSPLFGSSSRLSFILAHLCCAQPGPTSSPLNKLHRHGLGSGGTKGVKWDTSKAMNSIQKSIDQGIRSHLTSRPTQNGGKGR